ncbi:hypothetical protein CMI38_06920 [Candidatus Pacearchaeota archaeon]|jgi:hypothetical protein|nr:hypothetical protein [Candidatus Pacearchaeota archaeon]|tara:strand:- start:10227 stop:10532 length:306 start_codon:yes stop_codon:yes gene_type:complete
MGKKLKGGRIFRDCVMMGGLLLSPAVIYHGYEMYSESFRGVSEVQENSDYSWEGPKMQRFGGLSSIIVGVGMFTLVGGSLAYQWHREGRENNDGDNLEESR